VKLATTRAGVGGKIADREGNATPAVTRAEAMADAHRIGQPF